MKPLFIGCIICAMYSSLAAAQPRSLPFVGVWSDSVKGCRLMKQGALDRMSTAEASRYGGFVEITTQGFSLLYTSGTGECEFTTPYKGKVVAPPLPSGGPSASWGSSLFGVATPRSHDRWLIAP
jgi:hypothetical protein